MRSTAPHADASETQVPWDATPFVPPAHDLEALRRASESCRGCDLYQHAEQTVFGEGRAAARVVFIGERDRRTDAARL